MTLRTFLSTSVILFRNYFCEKLYLNGICTVEGGKVMCNFENNYETKTVAAMVQEMQTEVQEMCFICNSRLNSSF